MSKFFILCPVCRNYAESNSGFFASKNIRCACGNVIHVKADKMAMISCPSCGTDVVYDPSEGVDGECPVCRVQLVTEDDFSNLAHLRCAACGCHLQVSKSAAEITCPVCDTFCDVQQEIKKAEAREAAIPAVIRFEGDQSTFVWKHPMTDFVMGSRLIVPETREAVFFRNGEALDSFGPGCYTLETGVLPKMNRMVRLPAEGQPFHAEVYFVNMTTQMGIKWGTPTKVGLFDPATGMHVELGASGSFNLRVTDARMLVIRMMGTAGALSQSDLFRGGNAETAAQAGNGSVTTVFALNSGYFRPVVAAKVRSALAFIIKENRINVLELDEHLDSISIALREAINPELAEYGLEIPEFYVFNIATPDDDPNFRRMKQQHADLYLRTHEEEIKKIEAEVASERKEVEAQTKARVGVIVAQGEAEAELIKAQAKANAHRMQAEAEAQEMRMKGYTYQQETARQVGIAAVKNGFAAGSISGMAKDAVNQAAQTLQQAAAVWDCPSCGTKGISSKCCPECGAKRPGFMNLSMGWTCPSCGTPGIASRCCPECGTKRPD